MSVFNVLSARFGSRYGTKKTTRRNGRRRHNRAMSPKNLADGILSSKAPSLFDDDEDYEEGVWNTGEWRAVGGGRAKTPSVKGTGDVSPVAEGAAPQPPAVVAPTSQRARVLLLLFITLVGVLAGMAQVWVRLRIVRIGYELSTESARKTRLERVHQKLSVEHALLRNPKRVRELAHNRLGLRSPSPDEVKKIGTASRVFSN